jgi:hypothetical protein
LVEEQVIQIELVQQVWQFVIPVKVEQTAQFAEPS